MNKLKLTALALCALAFCSSAQAQFQATTNTATIVWNGQTGISGFQLFYWTSSATNTIAMPFNQTQVQVTGLTWSSFYTFALKAVNGTQVSSFSQAVTLVTPAPPFSPPPAPTGLFIRGP